jgi:hypothetical protein
MPGPSESRRRPGPGFVTAVLLAVLGLALGLRLWGLNWGLPWAFHPDEDIYLDPAAAMLSSCDPNPHYFENPSLLTYVIAAELLLIRALGPAAGPLSLDAPGGPNLVARLDSALLGSAGVGLVFAIGAVLFGRRAGLIAALFLAVSFLHVRDSHYGVNDVPATTLLLVSLYCDARLLRKPALRWYILAGLSGGLATSTKYNMGFFFVPLLVAHWLAQRQRAWKLRQDAGTVALPRRDWFAPALLLAAVGGLGGFAIGTPYAFLDYDRFRVDFLNQYRHGETPWLGQPPEPVPLQYLTTLLQGYGALPLVLAVVGLALAWHRHRAEALLVAAFPFAYLTFMLPKALFFARFAIPVLPFLCLLAGYGTLMLVRLLRPTFRSAGLAALLAAAVTQPLINDVHHNRIVTQPDTRVLASEWMQANLPHGSRLRVEAYSLVDFSDQPLTYDRADLRIELFRSTPTPEQLRVFVDRDVLYFVTSSYALERYLLTPRRQNSALAYQSMHRQLEDRAELIAQFGPAFGGHELPYSLSNVFTPYWNLELYERNGPTIRIYSLAGLANGGS